MTTGYSPKDTGKRIKDIRKKNGLTQAQFAEALNISYSHLAKVEVGSHACSPDLLVDIAIRFNVSLDYLMLGRDSESEAKKKLDLAIELLHQVQTGV